MKQGKTLTELAARLTHIQTTKRDFAVPVSQLQMTLEGALTFPLSRPQHSTPSILETHAHASSHSMNAFALNRWSGAQLASYTEIPKNYFDRLQSENKSLLADCVNHSLIQASKSNPRDSRLIRTIDGHVRGFLSAKYRMLDSYDLLETCLPVLIDNQFEVVSSELTESRMYLKVSSPKVQAEVKQGDVVQYGVMIQTSDVGASSLKVEPYITRLVCMNGMVMESTFRKAHLGSSRVERDVQELLTNETKRLNDAAFFATVRDYLTASMKPEMFELEVNKMRIAAEQPIKNFNLEQVVELTMDAVKVTGDNIKTGILHALANGNEGAGLTKWGLVNSITRASYAVEDLDYDQATSLERAGGAILNMGKVPWERIAG